MRRLTGIFVALLFFIGVASSHSSARVQTANLHVSGYGSSTTVSNTAYYTVGVVNNGPDSTDNVVVGGSTGLSSITSVSISQGSCTISGNSFSCNVGTLASGAPLTLSVQGQLPNFGSPHPDITFCGFSVSASGSASDPDTTDNSTTICILVASTGNCVPPGQCNPHH